MNIVYYALLLLIIFLIFFLYEKVSKYCPKKIKIYINIVISMFFVRYISLMLLCVVNKGTYVYLFKNLLYFDYLAIPLMVSGLSYVFLRWDKLDFNINYIIMGILTIIYFMVMICIKSKVVLDINYGYIVKLYNDKQLLILILMILGALFLLALFFYDKPNNNRKGMRYLIISILVTIIELVFHMSGGNIFPYPIIGDIFFLIIINLAINTFNKK